MSLKRRALRGATWAVAGGNASQVLSFIMFIAISRVVGPAAFGTVAVAIGIVELCRPLASEAVVGNLVARGRVEAEAFDAGFALSIGLALVLCAALVVGAPLFAIVFRTPDLAHVLPQLAVLLLFYAGCRVQEAHLTIELRFGSLAVRTVLAALIGGGVGILAAYAGFGVEALVLQQWTAAAVSLILLWIACPWRPRLPRSREHLRALMRESAALAPAGLVAQLSLLTDAMAVASFFGPAAAGLYNLGKRVRLALQLGLSTALDRVSLPTFARVRSDPQQLARTLETALRLSTLVAFPMFIGVAAIAPDLIALFLGPAWTEAAAPLTLLLVGGAVTMTTHYFDNILLVLDHRRWIILLRVLMLTLLGAALLLFGRAGPAHVAACALIAAFAHNLAGFTTVSRLARIPARTYLVGVLLPLGISLAMLALVTLARDALVARALPGFVRLGLLVALGALFYLSISWALARPAMRAAISAARTVLAR